MLWYYVLLVGTFVGSPLLTVNVPFFVYLIVMFPWSSNIIHIKTVLGRLGPGQSGPGQLGPGHLGPGQPGPWTIGPRTVGPPDSWAPDIWAKMPRTHLTWIARPPLSLAQL